MTNTTLPVAEHRHVGGSAGGPGENSAECACGTVFDGFDSQREAKKLLAQHIKDETKSKPVALLEVDEWIDLASLNASDIEGEALVRYVETYQEFGLTEPYTLVVFTGPGDPMPSSCRWPASKKARLLTEAEVARVQEETRREHLARQFEQLAELARRTDIPFPRSEQLHFDLPTRADVQAVGKALGIEPVSRTWSDGLQVSWPQGREPYDDGLHVLWHTSERAVAERELVLDAERGHVPVEVPGLDYGRDVADDPTPVSPARVPGHTGAVVAGGELVAETVEGQSGWFAIAPAEPVTVHFSFGSGHTDPDTGKDLYGRYVTIVGPSYDACRTAMFASKYGNRWSFDYLAGTPQANEQIPNWIEHERITLPADAQGAPDCLPECEAQPGDLPHLTDCPARSVDEPVSESR